MARIDVFTLDRLSSGPMDHVIAQSHTWEYHNACGCLCHRFQNTSASEYLHPGRRFPKRSIFSDLCLHALKISFLKIPVHVWTGPTREFLCTWEGAFPCLCFYHLSVRVQSWARIQQCPPLISASLCSDPSFFPAVQPLMCLLLSRVAAWY